MYKITLDTKPFIDSLKVLDKLTNKAIQRALARVALEFKKDVTPHTPRGSGDLLNSYKVETKQQKTTVGFDIEYAMYQEQGMRADGTYIIVNRPAGGKTHYTKETVEENKDKYTKIFEEELAKLLK